MTVRFEDTSVSREGRYSLGHDRHDDVPYLAIPVANRMVEYEEYYWLTRAEADQFSSRPQDALRFADECRDRKHDERLILAPGSDRGVAV
jgi:hypothetical protein